MRPLDGIKVVTLEHAIAAPFCTRQLADLGARVIKIERPGAGDFARGYDERVHGLASHFVWTNRSKESLSLDVKHVPLAIVVEDPSPEAAAVAAGFQLSPYFRVRRANAMPVATGWMLDRQVDGIVRIRDDFARRRHLGENPAVQIVVNGTDANRARTIQAYAHDVLAQTKARSGDADATAPAAGPVVLRSRIWFNEANESRAFLVPGLIVLVMTLIGAFLTALVPMIRHYGGPGVWRPQPSYLIMVARRNAPLAAADAIEWGTRRLDLFILGQVVPRRTVAIGKKSLGWIPLFGQLFWLGGNVLVDRKNAYQARKAMQTTTRTLRDDTSIWIFPEGTRNPGEQLLAFKKGAFHMAIEAGVPIVPVCVSRYTQRLGLNSWRQRTVIIRSLAPIATAGLTQQDLPALIEQCRSQMQHCIDHMESEVTTP